jgi:two-component system, cell cycle response regulator
MNKELLKSILEIKQLPSLPAVAVRVLELSRQKDSSVSLIAKAISTDPALSAKVLKTINSSFYSIPHPITTINQAVVLLGMQTLKTLALGFSLVRGLNAKGSEKFDYIRFWRQCLFSAVASRTVSKSLRIGDCEEAFLAGLLTDLGTLAMHRGIGADYDQLLEACQGDQVELVKRSREKFDLDHAEVGAALAEKWRFPTTLIEPIRQHHSLGPNRPPRPGVVEVVHAGVLCGQVFSSKKSGLISVAKRELATTFKMTEAKIKEMLAGVEAQTKEMGKLFEVKIDPGRSFEDIEEEARQTLVELSLEAQIQAQQTLVENQSLLQQATTDGLTGLANRARFDEFIDEAFTVAKARGEALSLLMIDLDRFKSINDTHGHQAGDAVLANLGAFVKSLCRSDDLASRYGGEEVAVVLRRTGLAEASKIAERIRESIAGRPVAFGTTLIRITASVGVAAMNGHQPVASPEELLGAADRALYAAKEGGRNTVRIASAEVTRGAA